MDDCVLVQQLVEQVQVSGVTGCEPTEDDRFTRVSEYGAAASTGSRLLGTT